MEHVQIKASMATNVQPTYEHSPNCETSIGGYENCSGCSGGPVPDCNGIGWRIEKDSPTSHHVAYSTQAGKEEAPGLEQSDRNDGFTGEVCLVENKDDENDEREDNGQDGDSARRGQRK